MPGHQQLTVYDAILLTVDLAQQTLLFEAQSHHFVVHSPHAGLWTTGAVGCSTLRDDESFRFHVYSDQRLRRAAAFDDPNRSLWGWTLGGLVLHIHAGIVPGINGQVVKKDVSPLTFEVPREFQALCKDHGITVTEVLRGFIADLCGLHNVPMLPREDGYSSNGSDERLHARQYWSRAYGWRAIVNLDG